MGEKESGTSRSPTGAISSRLRRPIVPRFYSPPPQLRTFEALKELDNCEICCEAMIDEMIMLPCGHRRICGACVKNLPTPCKCPMCNNPVESSRRVF
jgi:hypothetical protein